MIDYRDCFHDNAASQRPHAIAYVNVLIDQIALRKIFVHVRSVRHFSRRLNIQKAHGFAHRVMRLIFSSCGGGWVILVVVFWTLALSRPCCEVAQRRGEG